MLFIGVLEHLREPNKAIDAFNSSSSEFLYISVPLMSLSVFIENIFQNTFPRHLSGGHTHLFSHESLAYFIKSHKLEIISQWVFGVDSLDIMRALIHLLSKIVFLIMH